MSNLLWFYLSFEERADWEISWGAIAVLVVALAGVPALLATPLLPEAGGLSATFGRQMVILLPLLMTTVGVKRLRDIRRRDFW